MTTRLESTGTWAFSIARIGPQVVPLLILSGLGGLLARNYSVPPSDIAFSVIFAFYLIIANHLRFGNNYLVRERRWRETLENQKLNKKPTSHEKQEKSSDNEDKKKQQRQPLELELHTKDLFFSEMNEFWFAIYMFAFTLVGLIIPALFILFAPTTNHNNDATTIISPSELAAPHLFVLWCQIIMETLTMENPYFHPYIALLIPLGYSTYRIKLLMDWCLGNWSVIQQLYTLQQTILSNATKDVGGLAALMQNTKDLQMWYYGGLAISIVNLIMWTYNLFVMLLLRVTPEYLDGGKDAKCEYPRIVWIGQIFPVIKKEQDKKKDL